MPLSKARMRERKRQDRLVKPMSNPDTPQDVKPAIAGLKMDGNKIMGLAKPSVQPKGGEAPLIPLYNPAIHKPGDRVLVKPPYGKKLIEMTLPEIDADGYPIYD